MAVSLVTCVSNAGGIGPGHSAVDLSNTIYSFEKIDWGGDASAWLVTPRRNYFANNTHRPLVIQELTAAANESKCLAYIKKSIADDDDYLEPFSGVCSSMAANAIEASGVKFLNIYGQLDKPYDIFLLTRRLGVVKRETVVWPGKSKLNWLVRWKLEQMLKTLLAGVSPRY